MNTNIKPFYIYTERNSLYIKNINESSERLASNIYIYSANIDKNNNIQYYEGENAQKYKNSTELNRFNKIKKYEIKIADKNYLKINKKAKKGYVYASLLTPEIDYSSLQIYSSVELANLPTLLEIKSYHVENYYYDVEDIKQYITNLN